jgi:hypothetical protein
MRLILALVGTAFFCVQAGADELDFSFNSDAARVVYVRSLEQSKLQVDGGWLHHQDNGDALHIGLNLASLASQAANPAVAGLGGRFVYFDGDLSKQTGYAVAIGGFFRYPIPNYNRIAVGGQAYFAPDVLTFSDAEQYQDLSIRVSYNVMQEADLYIGARYVKGEYDKAKKALFDTGMHVGITLRF